jgi:hypothetical protein
VPPSTVNGLSGEMVASGVVQETPPIPFWVRVPGKLFQVDANFAIPEASTGPAT